MPLKKKAYRFRICPDAKQIDIINKTIGCARWIYNHFLAKAKENRYKNKTAYKNKIPALKREYEWLKESDSIALQQAVENLDDAFKRFFKGQNNFPKFKSKKNDHQSYRTQYFKRKSGVESIVVDGENHKIKLPKLGWVKYRKSREVKGRIQNATIKRSKTGKYYISIAVEQEIEIDDEKRQDTDKAIGIDLGLKTYLTSYNGEFDEIENPKHLAKYERKLAHLQKKLAKKKKGSNNWKKVKEKIAKLHEKIANIREDFLHKLSLRIVRENQTIIVEDLNVKGMLKNTRLAKHISDVAWGNFKTFLEYKADWYDREFHKVNTWFASTQLCNKCDTKNPKLKDLKIREWTCEKCGTVHKRDENAAVNIRKQGLRDLQKSA